MARYEILKNAVADVIKTNGNNEITGALLQQSLLAMINSLAAGYLYVSNATPSTNPGTPDQNVLYVTGVSGTYPNFGNIVVEVGEFVFLKYNGTWHKDVLGVATTEQLQQLTTAISNFETSVQQQLSAQDQDIAAFKAAIREQIADYEPIIINGNVTNAPDQEDITTDSNDLLKFANRGTLYGRGYFILRRNKTFAEQVTLANTVYEIRYDFDLGGATVTIPANCELHFCGGSVSNGSIVYNKTRLSGNVRMLAEFSPTNYFNTGGYLVNNDIYASWFGVVGGGTVDSSDAVQRAIDHTNNNMINLHIDDNNILLSKTINIHPLINARPYAIIGHTKDNPIFRVVNSNFTGECVFDIDNNLGSCRLSNICINFAGGEKTINGFEIKRTRNSVFQSISTYSANIGLHIVSCSYGSFRDCRFDSGNVGVSFDGSFNSVQFDWLHCGGNSLYGITSVAEKSPTNIIISGFIGEANMYHLYLNTGVFVFNNPYLADASLTPVVNKGASLTINGVGNGVGIGGAGSVEYNPHDNSVEINDIEIDGGETSLNNVFASDSGSPVGQLAIKNSNIIRHKSGLLYLNNLRQTLEVAKFSNNLIKTDNESLIRKAQCAENFALDGSNFEMGINYNLYKSHSNKYSITAEPTISYVQKTYGGGNIMRLTLPICESKRYGIVIPLRFPAWMIGKYCMASVRFRFNETETNAEMIANGHKVLTDSALHHKSWVNAEQANAEISAVGLSKKYASSNAWYGYTLPFVNCMEGTTTSTICTVDSQITTIRYPLKVHTVDDFLVLLFSAGTLATFTEDLVIDIEEIAVFSPEFANVMVAYKNSNEKFAFTTAQRPTFNIPAAADGFTMFDSTLKKTIRFDGTNWLDESGTIV